MKLAEYRKRIDEVKRLRADLSIDKPDKFMEIINIISEIQFDMLEEDWNEEETKVFMSWDSLYNESVRIENIMKKDEAFFYLIEALNYKYEICTRQFVKVGDSNALD